MNKINTINFKITTFLLGILLLVLSAFIIIYPDVSFNASLRGLKIWWEVIFPALLPFLITSEILLGTGIVHFMGVLLEPLMRPLFNVPGVGSFILAMGFSSGYPMGSKLATRFREQGMITRVEGERLVSFTTTSDPLFLFGAIAVGFFHDVRLGAFIALVHYLSSILVGIIMKFYKKNDNERLLRDKELTSSNLIVKAFNALYQARIKDGRKFGKLMGDAVMSSIDTLLMIGGFIIIFSVVLSLLSEIQFTLYLSKFLCLLLAPLGITPDLSNALIYGLFEVTLGAKNVSEVTEIIPMSQKLAVLSAISAWGGISVHAQVAAIIQKTDLRYLPFLLARIIHVVIAFFLSKFLFQFIKLENLPATVPAFLHQVSEQTFQASIINSFYYMLIWLVSLVIILFIVLILRIFLSRPDQQH
ncbi:MAG: sporulation integral membrane protein YlbJ [Vulcanibacillus sp.]